MTNQESSRAGRWDEREINRLRERKEELETERAGLDSYQTEDGSTNMGHTAVLEDIRNKVGNLRSRLEYTKSDMSYSENKLKEQEVLVASTTKQLSNLQRKLEKIEQAIQKGIQDSQQSIEKVKEAEEEHFGPFREMTGIRDFHAYEEATGKARDDFMKKRRQIREKNTKLTAQKEYEDTRDFKKPIKRQQDRISEKRIALEEAKRFEEELLDNLAQRKAKLADCEAKLVEAAEVEKGIEDEVSAAQKEFGGVHTEKLKLSKTINSEENNLERLRSKLHEVLQKARVDEVILPTIGATASNSRTRGRKRSHLGLTDEEEEEEEEETLTQPLSTQEFSPHFSQPEDVRVQRDQKDANQIDFSELRSNLKQKTNEREEKKIRNDFEQQISKVTAEIEGMAPNMKANDAYQNVSQRLKDSGTDFEKAKMMSRNSTHNFNKIKSQRTNRFKQAFDHIDKSLKM